MPEISVLGKHGDSKHIWDADKPEEIAAAKEMFDSLTGKGYLAFSVKKSGERGKRIREFDPKAEKIILAPPMAGG